MVKFLSLDIQLQAQVILGIAESDKVQFRQMKVVV